MESEGDYRKSHLNKGVDYHNIFIRPHTSMLWRLEKEILDIIYNCHFYLKPAKYLDFACGTGRILKHFYSRVDTAIGIDVSEKMVSIAREHMPTAKIIVSDITVNGGCRFKDFDFITAFRFFPNAQPSLRNEVIGCLASAINDSGIIVFNNHLNRSSTLACLGRLFGKAWHSMSEAEVYKMANMAGLRIIEKYPIGFLPLNDKWMLETFNIVETVERKAIRIFGNITRFAQDIIYVCEKC